MADGTRVPRLPRVAEVWELTALERRRLYAMVAVGDGPPRIRIRRTVRFSEAELARWIEDQQASSRVQGD